MSLTSDTFVMKTPKTLVGVVYHLTNSPSYNPNNVAIMYEFQGDSGENHNENKGYWSLHNQYDAWEVIPPNHSIHSSNHLLSPEEIGNVPQDHMYTVPVCILRYGKLISIIELISRNLLSHIIYQHQIHDNNHPTTSSSVSQNHASSTNFQQPVIAVSIPEGPCLPIAILAIHHLTSTLSNATNAPILLPLDPDEGKERYKYMLIDAKPRFILCVNHDVARIQNIVDSTFKDTNYKPLVINVATLFSNTCHDVYQPIPTAPSTYDDNIEFTSAPTNRISHIVYTSGTTGQPKGCISSLYSLLNYLPAKNIHHFISPFTQDIFSSNNNSEECNRSHPDENTPKNIFLASALPFDPCLGDILGTFLAQATLCISSRIKIQNDLGQIMENLHVSHVLCTPSLWNTVSVVSSTSKHNLSSSSSTTATYSRRVWPYLRVVALGGEPIPPRIISAWASQITSSNVSPHQDFNTNTVPQNTNNHECKQQLRLLATYGVTEACVYQTAGEVFQRRNESSNAPYHHVGKPFIGTKLRICKEQVEVEKDLGSCSQHHDHIVLEDVHKHGDVGEIVLYGAQLDEYSGYLNLPQLTKEKFRSEIIHNQRIYYYRTGDKGFIDEDGNLRILGRINGEEGMLKINGVRVELGEIEYSILDDTRLLGDVDYQPLVTGCVVLSTTVNEDNDKKLIAYCVLSTDTLNEIGLTSFPQGSGIICTPSPLLAVLRARCLNRLRKGCIPSTFILLERIPLTRTGKCNKKTLPTIGACVPMSTVLNADDTPLSEYGGKCGAIVMKELVDTLNLEQCQLPIVTTAANFAMLGGDSLAATRVTRALYSLHHGVNNSRTLGGSFGSLEGPFNAYNLIRAKSLGEYVDFLVENGAFCEFIQTEDYNGSNNSDDTSIPSLDESLAMYKALVEAVSLEQKTIIFSLLYEGADPNYRDHGKRLGKLNGRREQKELLRSNPLHIACVHGDVVSVKALIRFGCNCKSPDASGQYPIHLACSGMGDGIETDHLYDEANLNNRQEDLDRKECVKALLDLGQVPLSMKNGSKQTVLHCASRSGHSELIEYLMMLWRNDQSIKMNPIWGNKFDCQDKWFRTPIHWAVLHGKVNVLKILLKNGCSANPPKPSSIKGKKYISGAIESPMEICERLYGIEHGIGREMMYLLKNPVT